MPERFAGLAEAGYKRRLALAVNAVLAQPGAADVINSAPNELLDPAAAKAAAAAGTSVPPPPPAGRRQPGQQAQLIAQLAGLRSRTPLSVLSRN